MIAKTYRNAERATGVRDWIRSRSVRLKTSTDRTKLTPIRALRSSTIHHVEERLRGDALEETYAQLGLKLKSEFGGSSATVIISETAPYGAIGLSPTKSRRIRNGAIPCKLLSYDIFRKRA